MTLILSARPAVTFPVLRHYFAHYHDKGDLDLWICGSNTYLAEIQVSCNQRVNPTMDKEMTSHRYLFGNHSIYELMCEMVASAALLSHHSDTFCRYRAFEWLDSNTYQLSHTLVTHSLSQWVYTTVQTNTTSIILHKFLCNFCNFPSTSNRNHTLVDINRILRQQSNILFKTVKQLIMERIVFKINCKSTHLWHWSK